MLLKGAVRPIYAGNSVVAIFVTFSTTIFHALALQVQIAPVNQ